MFLQYLLICSALGAFNAQAKVVDSFNECNQFFYKGKEPQGMDQNAKKICQKTNNSDAAFATLYSCFHRIPLYSAYTYDLQCSQQRRGRCSRWYIEPQLSFTDGPDHMTPEGPYRNNVELLKTFQAINRDYSDTGYDRGHMHPYSFDCSAECKATFTLTNAIPLVKDFNQNHWRKWEDYLKTFLNSKLQSDIGASVYIVTGAVPGNERIPKENIHADNRETNRVTVPSHIWTAVCYVHPEPEKSFSFGYIGRNNKTFNILLKSVSDMNQQLSELYSRSSGASPSIQIFHDDCFGRKPASQKATLEFFHRIKLLKHKRLQIAENPQFFLALKNDMSSNIEITTENNAGLTGTLAFDSFSSFFTSLEALKNQARSACVLTDPANQMSRYIYIHTDLRKREVSAGAKPLECQLVPEKSVDGKTAADGSPCSYFKDNDYRCTCSTQNDEKKLCCSTPCLYHDELKGYSCYSGEKQIPCSPQYSLIAIRGKRCRDDHPCATYGENYYWCYTDSWWKHWNFWEYCSPPLPDSRAIDGKNCRSDFACARYGESEPMCFTDYNNWNYCCTSDDCFSVANYKTCKPDHPCGYHGENYLWCNTTDDSWNYCCRECS